MMLSFRPINTSDFNLLLKSSFHPLTPVFLGSWRGQFNTKWRGVSADLSYNTYLRNGWVVIDTGVKSETGTPIVEFSSWEPYVSDYSITLPNVMSYKFFFKKSFWRVGFLARTSIVANEAWGNRNSNYFSIFNNTKVTGFSRTHTVAFLLNARSVLYLLLRFAPFYRAVCFFNHLDVSSAFRLFDLNRVKTLELISLKTICTFTTEFVFKALRTLLLGRSGITRELRRKKTDLFLTPVNSAADIVLRLNVLFLMYSYVKLGRGALKLLERVTYNFWEVLISTTSFAKKNSPFIANKLIVYLTSRTVGTLTVSNLSFPIFVKFLLKFFLLALSNFVSGLQIREGFSSSRKFTLFAYKLKATWSLNKIFKVTDSALKSSSLKFSDFLKKFAPRFFSKKSINLNPVKSNKRSFRVAGGRRNTRRVRATSIGAHLHPKIVKYRYNACARFKLVHLKKQFLFFKFWSLNFFSFFSVRSNSRGVFWVAARLRLFFKLFLKFIRYYSFTVEYFNLAVNESIKNHNFFLIKFAAVRLYLYLLLKKTRALLSAFFAFCNKAYRRSALDFFNRAEALGALYKRVLSFSLDLHPKNKLSTLRASSVYSVPVQMRVLLAEVFKKYAEVARNFAPGLPLRLRTYLKFVLLTRHAAFFQLTRTLQAHAKSSAVNAKNCVGLRSHGFLNSVAYFFWKLKLLHIFRLSRKNLVFLLRSFRASTQSAFVTNKAPRTVRKFVSRLRLTFGEWLKSCNFGEFGTAVSAFSSLTTVLHSILRLRKKGVVNYTQKNLTKKSLTSFRHTTLRFTTKQYALSYLRSLLAYNQVHLSFFAKNHVLTVWNNYFCENRNFITKLTRIGNYCFSQGIRNTVSTFPSNTDENSSVTERLGSLSLKSLFVSAANNAFFRDNSETRRFNKYTLPARFQVITALARMANTQLPLILNYSVGSTLNTNKLALSFARISKSLELANFLAFSVVLSASQLLTGFVGVTTRGLARCVSSSLTFNFQTRLRALFYALVARVSLRGISIDISARARLTSYLKHSAFYSRFLVINPRTYWVLYSLNRAVASNGIVASSVSQKLPVKPYSRNLTFSLCYPSFTLFSDSVVGLTVRSNRRLKSERLLSLFLSARRVNILSRLRRNLQARARRGIVFGRVSSSYLKKNPTPKLFRNFRSTFAAFIAADYTQFFFIRQSLLGCKKVSTGRNNFFMLPAPASRVLVTAGVYTRSLMTDLTDVARVSYSQLLLKNLANRTSFLPVFEQVRSVAFRKVRAIRKILLRSNARRLGIFPKRNRALKKMYWRLVNRGKIDRVIPDYQNSLRSMFDRRNKHSMELSPSTTKRRFRFTTVKLQFSLKKRLWLQLTALLARVHLVLRQFRLRLWRRRFYRIFRAGRWLFRKKAKKHFLRLIVKAIFFLRTLLLGKLKPICKGGLVPFEIKSYLNGHNCSFFLNAFYAKFVQRLRSQTFTNFVTKRVAFFKESKLTFVYKFVYYFFKKAFLLLSVSNFIMHAGVVTGAVLLGSVSFNPRLVKTSDSVICVNRVSNFYSCATALPMLFLPTASVYFTNSELIFYGGFRLFTENLSLAVENVKHSASLAELFNTNRLHMWKRAYRETGSADVKWNFILTRKPVLLRNARAMLLKARRLNSLKANNRLPAKAFRFSKILRHLNLGLHVGAARYARLVAYVRGAQKSTFNINKSGKRFSKRTIARVRRNISRLKI